MVTSDMLIAIIAYGFVYILIGIALLPGVTRFLVGHGFVRSNYMQEMIPTAFGLYLYSMLIVQSLLLLVWPPRLSPYITLANVGNEGWSSLLQLYLVWSGMIFWAGWVDDTNGNRLVKGFKGHIGSLLQEGIVTTGLVKAGMAGLVGLWVVMELGGAWYERIIRFVVIVLCTNSVNLLDLRPGRAIKGFYLGSIVLFLVSSSLLFLPYWLPYAIFALLVLPRDLGGKAMLGDTGANLLGFGLGFSLSIGASNGALLVMSVLLIALNWTAERSSLTTIIESNFVLNAIDQWGRLR